MTMEAEIAAGLIAAGVDPGSVPVAAVLAHRFAMAALDQISRQLDAVLAPYGDIGEGRPAERVAAALLRAEQQGRKSQGDRLDEMGVELAELMVDVRENAALRSIVRKVQMGAGLTVRDGALAGQKTPEWGYALTRDEVAAWNAATAEAPPIADG